jgi:type III secretion protein C
MSFTRAMVLNFKRLFLVVGLFCILSVVDEVPAADMHWRNAKVDVVHQQKKLTDALREFAGSQGWVAVISPAIDGFISGKFNMPAAQYLDLLAISHGLIWYFDGQLLYFYASDESRTQLIRLTYASIDEVRRSMANLRVTDARFPLQFDPAQNTLVVSGPLRYVEMVEQVVGLIEDSNRGRSVDVRVYPLKHAWAQDQNIRSGGRDVMMPGVATTLRQIIGNGGSQAPGSGATSGGGTSPAVNAGSGMNAMTKLGNSSNSSAPGGQKNSGNDGASRQAGGTSSSANTGGGAVNNSSTSAASFPQIQADARLNAVLVRDYPDRLDRYDKLVASLDQRVPLIEIEAAVMDVSSSNLESLGVSWRGALGGALDLQIGGGLQPVLSQSGGALIESASTLEPAGVLLTTMTGNASRYLLARVNALAQTGQAKLVSTPKLLTLSNMEASLENSSSFYVPIQGTQQTEGQLFNVSVGMTLRVTPQVVQEPDGTYIRLAVTIEDGSILDQKIKEIPIVRRNTVVTQALIREGQSLLISGHTYEEEKDARDEVPGLGGLPFVGGLFRHTEKKRVSVDRLLLITPRMLSF